jgi:hypothetical protein
MRVTPWASAKVISPSGLPIALRIIASNTGSAKVTIPDIDVSTRDEVVVTSATGFDGVVVTAGVLQAARFMVSKTVIKIL